MKRQLRLSPTLLDSFAYYMSIEDNEQSAVKRTELLARLRGEEIQPSEAMLDGIQFEQDVLNTCTGKLNPDTSKPYGECVVEVAEFVYGGTYQYPIRYEFNGIMVEGFIDFLKRNKVVDIKTTSKYDIGKYLFNNQHLAYLLGLRREKINNFVYIVTDFRNVYKEEYNYHPDFENKFQSNISAFLGYLENDNEMKEAYYDIYINKESKVCNTIPKI